MEERNYLDPAHWMISLQGDYLEGYVPGGGSSVKVVVASENDRDKARSLLSTYATAAGFALVSVDSASTRMHMVHHLFAALAKQIDWRASAESFMRRILSEQLTLPSSGPVSVDALADLNGQAPALVRQELQRLITQEVFRDYSLCREFRLAATALCRATYDPSADIQQEATDVEAWLVGRLERMSSLRRLSLYRKIGRNNARQMLYSTTRWLRKAGHVGTLIIADISRYSLGRDADSSGFQFTKFATLDMHEVLRQFIDGTDEMHSSLSLFLTDDRFLVDERLGLRNYEALRLRLTDDVRDRSRPNPFAPMVRLRSPQ
ncbi:MAG: BREX system ATP-binding domain-containing protein [Vulcanimicrobiaceae bacterium]|jgi:hypothetical protein